METYTRRKGIFSSLKSLTTTTLQGTESVVTNAINTTVHTTNIAVTATSAVDNMSKIWAGSLLRSVESNAKVTDMELLIEEAHIEAELTELRAVLAKAKKPQAKKPVGRPAKAK